MKALNVKETAKKNNQGKSTKCFVQSTRLLLVLGIVGFSTPIFAIPGEAYEVTPTCNVIDQRPTNDSYSETYLRTNRGATVADTQRDSDFQSLTIRTGSSDSSADPYEFFTYSTTPPTTETLTPTSSMQTQDEPFVPSGSSQTVYVSRGAGLGNEVCTYVYSLSFDGTTYTRTLPTVYNRLAPSVSNPTAVPIFTPLGVIAMMSGLLWFGRRRTLKLKS